MYLVDTNIVSVTAPSRPVQENLVAWLEQNTASLFLSVITIAEIEDGIAKARREGATRKAGNLTSWRESLLHLYAPRILPFHTEAARIAGHLADHALVILTRNLRDFLPLGMPARDLLTDF